MDKKSDKSGPGRKRHGDYSKFYKKSKPGPKKKSNRKTEKSFPSKSKKRPLPLAKNELEAPSFVRLNKYIANAGICSRREADELVATMVKSLQTARCNVSNE